MTEPCVEIEGVTKRFGEDLVLKEVNLVMESGKVYGIVETTVPARPFS